MVATFTNASDGKPIELVCRGDWFDRKATITLGDRVVAQIGRSFFNVREFFGNKQSVSKPNSTLPFTVWLIVLRYSTWCLWLRA